MQMGARWQAGDPPHRSVPAALHQEITRQEALHPAADSWTLTWLEGLPRCALDDAALLTLDGGDDPDTHDYARLLQAARGRPAG